MVAANSVVLTDVPEGATAVGNPAKAMVDWKPPPAQAGGATTVFCSTKGWWRQSGHERVLDNLVERRHLAVEGDVLELLLLAQHQVQLRAGVEVHVVDDKRAARRASSGSCSRSRRTRWAGCASRRSGQRRSDRPAAWSRGSVSSDCSQWKVSGPVGMPRRSASAIVRSRSPASGAIVVRARGPRQQNRSVEAPAPGLDHARLVEAPQLGDQPLADLRSRGRRPRGHGPSREAEAGRRAGLARPPREKTE